MIIATGLSGAACAQSTTDVVNVQLDNDPFTAGLNVVVGDVLSATAAATALGNTLSVSVETGDLTLHNTQTLNAAGLSQSVVHVNSASESLDSVATTFGNSATITTCCGSIDAVSIQETSADATMTVISDVTIDDWALNPTSTASAIANAVSYETWGGEHIVAWASQTNNADVLSEASMDVDFIADSATVTATSMGNSATMGGEDTTSDVDALQLNLGGNITARAIVNSDDGVDVISTATATGNGYNVENQFGYARVVSTQENAADIEARSEVTLNDWNGWNASSAYAVANSTLASNIGSDMDMVIVQENDGGVEAIASFDGGNAGNGGVGANPVTDFVTSSTAFGNVVSGFICTTCGGGIGANNRQINTGNINSTTSVTAGSGGSHVATASAVGNSATFHTVETGPH